MLYYKKTKFKDVNIMKHIAILGFGVVGSGTAKLLTDNKKQVTALAGSKINIKYILDLRDFPESPFADRVIHDYNMIVNDPEVSVVIEVMGGSHPAYEYTVAALNAGKSVITSNKEVVAKYGDEFLALAKKNKVSYRFEAAVGGGIPVIEPLISCVRHNDVSEIRGILNGTTNYILTQMFTFGKSFETALKDAQAKGYAESNPDADILGIDACRKIAILTAIATGKLVSTEIIHTEGITAIRAEDVAAADKLGCTIKLLGRCRIKRGVPSILVAPYLIPKEEPLAAVNDVYNAVEVCSSPLENVMFYGRGAGAGPTASAVVADLVLAIRNKARGITPVFEKSERTVPVSDMPSKFLITVGENDRDALRRAFRSAETLESGGEFSVLTTVPARERDVEAKLEAAGIDPIAMIRAI